MQQKYEWKIECIVTRTLSNVSIIIKDNGIGLTKEEKFAIYQAFELQSGDTTPYNEGVNIELAIVKELVQLHRGQIHLESDVDHGSTYTVSFPQSPNISLNNDANEINNEDHVMELASTPLSIQ